MSRGLYGLYRNPSRPAIWQGSPGSAAAAATTTTTFVVTAVNLSGSTLNLPATNAGVVIGAITTTTNPPGHTQNTPITLGGPDAALFAITNGGIIPCNLVVGASNIAAGSYHISLTAN